MIPLEKDGLEHWRAEIDLGVEFRDREFGTYQQQKPGAPPTSTLSGKNLDDFEEGARETAAAPLNLYFPITKNIVPTLFYQNPRASALSDTRDDQASEDAFYASELVNRDLRNPLLRIKDTMQQMTFDDYVLGFGIVKVGYATEFGPDILPTKAETKQSFRERVKAQVISAATAIGLLPPKPPTEEPEQVQADLTIRAESPYLKWISPFDFVIDPRARTLEDARWIAQRIRRTLADIKRDRRYGKAKYDLEPEAIDDDRIPMSAVEEFQTVDVWEVHYKTLDAPTGIRVLTLACTQSQTKPLGHQDSAYDIGGWQYEWQCLNKHGHRLYPISTLSIARPLIDRMNSTFTAILEQVDKFQAKIAVNERVTPDGITALKSNVLSAVIKVTGSEDVRAAVSVIAMEQVAADMVGFVKQVMDFVLLMVGLTQAQLTGLTTAQTATEAQIGQGGQNLRRTDEANLVGDSFNRIITKYWRVKAQFQDLTTIDLPKGEAINPQTQMAEQSWYPPIDQSRADRLKATRFQFHLEIGSMQKPNLEIIRSQFENFARALMEPIVQNGLALEGKRLSASEIIRQWSRFFEEYGLTSGVSKMVVPIQDPMQQQALLSFGQKPTGTNGAANQLTGSVPNRADMISAAAGEKGQGVPLA